MDWIKIKKDSDQTKIRDQLPKDRPFLALWKGAICLCEFDEELSRFWIGFMPVSYLGFWKLDLEREIKFTHFLEIHIPDDY